MLRLLSVIALILAFSLNANAATTGKLTGGLAHEFPDWFKQSFLDFKEDAAESAASNKHTIIFMTLTGCPYCARMLKESFYAQPELVQRDFDTIGLNIRGDRMVMIDGKTELSEKQLARKMRVRFTPTIIFLDENAKTVFRVNGYWDPVQFRYAMSYVASKSYKTMKITDYVKQQKSKPVWNFATHKSMQNITDFSKIKTPLLLLFEDKSCTACKELHEKILNLPAVTKELDAYTFVRLDSRSNQAITDIDGNRTTPEKWAEKLNIRLTPTFIAFDEGKERQRFDSKLYSHHFISILSYVSGGNYKTYDNWLKYNSARTQKILKTGKNIDLRDRNVTASE